MKAVLVVFFGLVLLGGVLLVMAPGGLVDAIPVYSWRLTGSTEIWPQVDHVDVSVELSPPGGFAARATLQLSDIRDEHFALMLNSDLSVTEVSAEGHEVSAARGFGLGTDYHREGRVVHFDLDEVPADGQLSLQLQWSGEGAYGPEGSDWRGILLVDEHEARMCEQTIFYPQVPLAVDGPAVQRSTFALDVTAPAAWELFCPGQPVGTPEVSGDRRRWRYISEQPALFSIVGGDRVRNEIIVGERRVVTLLRSEHASLGADFAGEANTILETYNDWFGPGGSGSLCIFEQSNRKGYSYNWFANGLAVFDKGALGGGVPVLKLAHEMAHMWWGQAVSVDGPGERFLTEGLSEASSWMFLEHAGRDADVRWSLDSARKDIRELSEEGLSLALNTVDFGVRHYTKLAYAKGGLVHRYVLGTLGEQRAAAFIRAYRGRIRGGVATLADWRAALAEVAPLLPVPWVDHAGDLQLSLHDVAWDGATSQLTGTILAEPVGTEASFPLTALVVVEIVGPGFSARREVLVDGGTTQLELTLDEARLGDAGGVVFAVRLDPDSLLPLGRPSEVVLEGPGLLESSPAQGASAVPMGLSRIEVLFDEPLQPFTVVDYQQQRCSLPPGMSLPIVTAVQLQDQGRRVVFVVRPLSPGKNYRLPLRGALRTTEDAVPLDDFLRFDTAPSNDETPPRVLSCDPPNGATGIAVSTSELTLVFNEPMMRGSGFSGSAVRSLQSDGYGYPEMDFGYWDDSGTVWTIPVKSIGPGIEYVLPIGRPLKDLSGNQPEAFEYHFSTAGAAGDG